MLEWTGEKILKMEIKMTQQTFFKALLGKIRLLNGVLVKKDELLKTVEAYIEKYPEFFSDMGLEIYKREKKVEAEDKAFFIAQKYSCHGLEKTLRELFHAQDIAYYAKNNHNKIYLSMDKDRARLLFFQNCFGDEKQIVKEIAGEFVQHQELNK